MRACGWIQVLLVLGTGCFLAACGTFRHQRQEQVLAVLEARGSELTRINQSLAGNPDPKAGSHVALFLAIPRLNRLIAMTDGLSVEVPCTPGSPCPLRGTYLFLDALRLNVVDGFPGVSIKAWAKRRNTSLEVQLDGSAVIRPTPNDPTSLDMSFVIDGIQPVIRTPLVTWRVHRLLRDLLLTKMNDFSASLPVVHIPIKREFPFEFEGIARNLEFDLGQGSVAGDVRNPGFKTAVTVRLADHYFLEDGLHLFFVME